MLISPNKFLTISQFLNLKVTLHMTDQYPKTLSMGQPPNGKLFKNTFNNTGEKHLIHFMGLPVVFYFESSDHLFGSFYFYR